MLSNFNEQNYSTKQNVLMQSGLNFACAMCVCCAADFIISFFHSFRELSFPMNLTTMQGTYHILHVKFCPNLLKLHSFRYDDIVFHLHIQDKSFQNDTWCISAWVWNQSLQNSKIKKKSNKKKSNEIISYRQISTFWEKVTPGGKFQKWNNLLQKRSLLQRLMSHVLCSRNGSKFSSRYW